MTGISFVGLPSAWLGTCAGALVLEKNVSFRNLLVGGCLAAAIVAAPLSSASAGPWHHHRCWFVGCVFDAAGAVVVGAATIATAPLVAVANAADSGPAYGPAPDYGPPPAYGPGPGYGPPPTYWPGPGYYGPGYYGPRYYHRPRWYNRHGWYRPRPPY